MTFSFAQMIDTFPEAVPAAKRASKQKIKEIQQQISGLSDFRDLWTKDIQKLNFKLQPAYITYLDDLIERLRYGYEKELKKYQYQVSYIDNLRNPQPQPKRTDPITPERVERARAYPIEDLLEIKRGTTLCIFHDDHKPSLKIYPDNHVYCFSCMRRADVIDIYMALNGCGFQEAVRKLAP